MEHLEWLDTLQDLQREGKIREIGVSIRDYRPEDGIPIAKSGWIATEQVVYNLFEQRPAQELFPVCATHGVGIIARVIKKVTGKSQVNLAEVAYASV
ncbi:aldo/keto reductase [Paenibacillus roseipurpureus]|uniref:Aldo/keto reductase n=1 Tax=Paenibacillus roseopurpureus TaxID=2918901 RepID=A0AA96LRN5_9BACL|nr:aldo/keto reductase [Paenibacillus sp. MBLB1832]WNR45959.1 aldo/keto reductase [Paenibacillus sp. MBLB1832]